MTDHQGWHQSVRKTHLGTPNKKNGNVRRSSKRQRCPSGMKENVGRKLWWGWKLKTRGEGGTEVEGDTKKGPGVQWGRQA